MNCKGKKIFGNLCFVALLLCGFVFSGCTAEVNLKLNKDGSVSCYFSGAAGVAFNKLIYSASGIDPGEGIGEVVFDIEEISSELEKNGFSEVQAVSKKGTDLSVSMIDLKKKSTLFTSGIVSQIGDKLKIDFTAKKLLDFYKASDEEIVSFLDMLLAPVFNEEEMSESEYVETVSAFYGEDAGEEISDARLVVHLTDAEGKTVTEIYPLVSLLTIK